MDTTSPEIDMTTLRIPPEVKALMSAFRLSHPDHSLLEKLTEAEWASLLAFSDLAQLTLPLAQLPIKGMPHWVGERLRTSLADNALRFERVKATYREVNDALESAGVEHVVIKGFTQSPDYVADPRIRPQSDIDMYCPRESIDAAYSACEAIGYRSSDVKISYARADHRASLVRPGHWKWGGKLYDPEMPLSIELHFCLWNEHVSRIAVPGPSFFWDRRTRREVDGLSFSCLSPVDHLAYFALHILRNVLARDWIIHHVRELAVFLHNRADDESFWNTWEETHSPSLRSLAAIAFYYARAWFGCQLNPLAQRDIDRLPDACRSWLRHFSGSALKSMFYPNKDSVWLHLALLPTRGDKWAIFKWTFLPAGMGPIGYVPIQVRNRRLVPPRDRHPWLQYAAYLSTRSIAFGRISLATLGRGLRWRLLQDVQAPRFWPDEI